MAMLCSAATITRRTPRTLRPLLDRRINSFGLKIPGSPLEPIINQVYGELRRRGLRHFRPTVYLTDQWCCLDPRPLVGLPFYLADPRLAELERIHSVLESPAKCYIFLRHEFGHSFCYSYRLQLTTEFRKIFGSRRRPYRHNYKIDPNSRNFVRHMSGNYAQKHPEEDFAETFAVWLTPGSNWRSTYRGWPALAKLQYVGRMAKKFANRKPLVLPGQQDLPVEKIRSTLRDFYRRYRAEVEIG